MKTAYNQNESSTANRHVAGSPEDFDRQLASFQSGYAGDTPIIYLQK